MFRTVIGAVLFAVVASALSAQSLKPIVTFDQTNGEDAFGPPIQAKDGNLYGATVYGGAANDGTIYKISRDGVETVLYSFCSEANCADGKYPSWLTQAADGDFYGTAFQGGTNNQGTIFKITANGALTTLYSFCSKSLCADGATPQSALLQTGDGSFYGTTILGGAANDGTIFRFTPGGKLTTIYSFCAKANCADGSQPYIGLTLARGGNLYGTTALGGNFNTKHCPADGCGTVFGLNRTGKVTTIYTFCSQANCADGDVPQGLLVQGKDGSLYGTTDGGGAKDAGTTFKIDPNGKFTSLHSFCTGSCPDGLVPYAGLIQATDGNFYGTANAGGPKGFGTIYQMTPAGEVTTIFGFDGGEDGAFPAASVLEGSDKNLYGGTEEGGDDNCFSPSGCGVIFQLSAKKDEDEIEVFASNQQPIVGLRPATVLRNQQ